MKKKNETPPEKVKLCAYGYVKRVEGPTLTKRGRERGVFAV
jgi:hypothetical protein